MNLKFGSKIPSAKQIGKVAANFWQKIHTLLFFAFFASLLAFGGYIWQQSLNGKGWSDVKKQEYLNKQNKKVIFDENNFTKVINNIQARKDASNVSSDQMRDIFKAY